MCIMILHCNSPLSFPCRLACPVTSLRLPGRAPWLRLALIFKLALSGQPERHSGIRAHVPSGLPVDRAAESQAGARARPRARVRILSQFCFSYDGETQLESGQYTQSRPSQKQGKELGRPQGAANRRRRTGRGNTASQARTPNPTVRSVNFRKKKCLQL